MAKVTRRRGPDAAALQRMIDDAGKVECKVGWFASAKYEDGTSVAYVAAIQEFGVPEKNIPPRMGLRSMTEAEKAHWAQIGESSMKRVLKGSMTFDDALELIGAVAEGDIRKQIASVDSPSLAEATILARIRKTADGKVTITLTKPLVDTGLMLASVTHNVGPKGSGDDAS